MNCQLVRRHLDAYLDEELDATPLVEFERHLNKCAECRDQARFSQAVKTTIARDLKNEQAPRSLEIRISRALDGVDGAKIIAFAWGSGRSTVGLIAVAATVLLAIGSILNSDNADTKQASLAANYLPVLSDIVNNHEDQLPTEIQTEVPAQAVNWFRGKLGFRVESPEFNQPQVRLVGARVSYVDNSRAAKLVYNVGDSRITLIAFRPKNDLTQMGGRRERIGKREVTYQTVRGYTVPIIQHNGIAYAFTGDLDQQTMLHLVASAQIR
ncbi:MAG: zf-HC2 domain-containing protein [Deltaproteobacteria bacterium]|nr:zf-HC2 domain-containing protein [Deltaproteobacteria bacterium]